MAPSTSARDNGGTVLEPKKPYVPAEGKIVRITPDFLITSGEDQDGEYGDINYF